jgi:hypothetical protein
MTFRLNRKLTQAAAQQLEIPGAEGEYKYIPAFIGIEDVVAACHELGVFPQTILGHIIESNEPALMMVTELGNYIPASDERRAWAKRYVLKCWQKPRLRYASRMRVDGGVGWWVNDIAPVLFEDEGIELHAIEAPPASIQAGSKAKAGRKPGKHKEMLTKILEAIQAWAAADGKPFDRYAMPGPLGASADEEGSFHWFCATLYPHDFMKSARAFEEHRAGVCAMAAWAKPSDLYRQALPHIAHKLGAALDISRLPTKARKPRKH